MTSLDFAIAAITQAIRDIYPPEDPDNDDIRRDINAIIDHAEDGYKLLNENELDYFEDQDWFEDEALVIPGLKRDTYLIPFTRYVC